MPYTDHGVFFLAEITKIVISMLTGYYYFMTMLLNNWQQDFNVAAPRFIGFILGMLTFCLTGLTLTCYSAFISSASLGRPFRDSRIILKFDIILIYLIDYKFKPDTIQVVDLANA